MNAFDVMIILALTFFVYKGAQAGMIKEVLGLTGWLLAAILALKFGQIVGAQLIVHVPELPGWSIAFAGFAVALLGTRFALYLLVQVFKKSMSAGSQDPVNKFFGAVIGFAKGAFVVSIFILAIHAMSLGARFADYKEQSVFFMPMSRFAQVVIDTVVNFVPQTKPDEESPPAPPAKT